MSEFSSLHTIPNNAKEEMMMLKRLSTSLLVAALMMFAAAAQAGVTIDTVTVGDPGNLPNADGYGDVGYTYQIGKYEVTNAQYTGFLNAVDPNGINAYGLYSANMGNVINYYGGISLISGNSPGSKYVPIAGRSNLPVNNVSFWDACRFANWLNNGQGSASTETGAYTLTSVSPANDTVIRNTNWTWAVASEDEWFKAAYYDPKKPGGAGYWKYATASNTAPTAEPPPGTDAVNGSANNDYPGPGPFDFTSVGAYTFKPSTSAYGTFDQDGNAGEWTDSFSTSTRRIMLGGNFRTSAPSSLSSQVDAAPTWEFEDAGFRVVANSPEPGSIALLLAGSVTLLIWRLRRNA